MIISVSLVSAKFLPARVQEPIEAEEVLNPSEFRGKKITSLDYKKIKDDTILYIAIEDSEDKSGWVYKALLKHENVLNSKLIPETKVKISPKMPISQLKIRVPTSL